MLGILSQQTDYSTDFCCFDNIPGTNKHTISAIMFINGIKKFNARIDKVVITPIFKLPVIS